MHAWLGQSEIRHVHEPAASGKGLGFNQTLNIHYAQTTLNAGDRLLFFGRAPNAWDSTLNDAAVYSSSSDALHRRLSTLTSADLNAVLIQATEGAGAINLLKGMTVTPPPLTVGLSHEEEAFASPKADSADAPSARVLQPSAYAIPPQQEEVRVQEKSQGNPLDRLPRNPKAGEYPNSIPRAQVQTQPMESDPISADSFPAVESPTPALRKRRERVVREPLIQTRQAAKAVASAIQFTRRASATFGEKFRNFMPRFLPDF